MDTKVGTGLGATTARIERRMVKDALDNFAQRVKDTGRFPGTHTLGVEFATKK